MIRNTALAQLTKEVAAWLPPGWRYNHLETGEWQDPEILGPGRMMLRFRDSWQHKGMITVFGCETRVSINCTRTRPAKAIAADIKRRLLDKYAREHTRILQERAEQQAKANELELIAQCFERLGLIRQHWQHNTYEIALHGNCHVKASQDRCRLEISLPPDKALQLVGFLNSLQRESHEA